jgi:peroxiredoxin
MLQPGAPAPDFAVADRTLYGMLDERDVAVFFFPKAFTPG